MIPMQDTINLAILSGNALVAVGLKNKLENRFPDSLAIQNYYDQRTFLKRLDGRFQVVIADYIIGGESSFAVLNMARAMNPGIRVIMHTSEDQVARAIEAIVNGHEQASVITAASFSNEPINFILN